MANIPSSLKYSKDHEWIQLTENGEALVGITDFAQGELGDIVFIDINTVGESLAANAVFGSVEAVKTVSDLFLPVAGTILEVNTELEGSPELVNGEPYGKGWIVKIKVDNPQDLETLLSAESYGELINA